MSNQKRHPLQGKLASLASSAQKPDLNVMPIPIKKLTARRVYSYYTRSERPVVNNVLLGYLCSRFRDSDLGLEPIPEADLAAGYISILINILSPESVLHHHQLRPNFTLTGYHLIIEPMDEDEIDTLVGGDQRWESLEDQIEDIGHRIVERDLFLVMAGVILLCLGKQVNTEGYLNWYRKRVRAFAGSLGYKHAETVLTDATSPTAESLLRLHSFFSASRTLRAQVFTIIVAGAKGDTRVSNLFKDILVLFHSAEMNHIMLIDKYLYSKYPELRAMRCLQDENEPMRTAWNFLEGLRDEERFYVKLLRSKEDTSALNRNNFPLYHAAAFAAARFENPSMKNFKSDDDDRAEQIKEVVERYLHRRLILGPIGLGEDKNSSMGQKEAEAYFSSVMSDIEGISKEAPSAQRD